VATVNHSQRFRTSINNFHRPWGRYHHRWYRGSWANWSSYPAFWAGLAGGTWLTPWAGGGSAFSYYNPYYDPSVYGNQYPTVPLALDYSQPIETPTDAQSEDEDDAVVQQAMGSFDQARALFKQGRYEDALVEVNRSLILLPGDRTMQEFRGLCLFALRRYSEAPAVIYAVLADGPGWDWNTLISLYPDVDTYTRQLRALEDYVQANPDNGALHFLLGYHYLVMDDKESAAVELRTAATLAPKDTLSAQLADALSRQLPDGSEEDER